MGALLRAGIVEPDLLVERIGESGISDGRREAIGTFVRVHGVTGTGG